MPPPGVEAPPPWTDPHAAEGRGPGEHVGVGPDLRVLEPADARQRYIIDMLASYVCKDGCALEQVHRGTLTPKTGASSSTTLGFAMTSILHLGMLASCSYEDG